MESDSKLKLLTKLNIIYSLTQSPIIPLPDQSTIIDDGAEVEILQELNDELKKFLEKKFDALLNSKDVETVPVSPFSSQEIDVLKKYVLKLVQTDAQPAKIGFDKNSVPVAVTFDTQLVAGGSITETPIQLIENVHVGSGQVPSMMPPGPRTNPVTDILKSHGYDPNLSFKERGAIIKEIEKVAKGEAKK